MISIHLYYIQSTIYPESYFCIAWHRALPWLDDYPYISDNASIGMKITLIPFNDHNMSLGMVSFNSPTRNSWLVKEWRWGGPRNPKWLGDHKMSLFFESTMRVFLKPSLMYIVHCTSSIYLQRERFILFLLWFKAVTIVIKSYLVYLCFHHWLFYWTPSSSFIQ